MPVPNSLKRTGCRDSGCGSCSGRSEHAWRKFWRSGRGSKDGQRVGLRGPGSWRSLCLSRIRFFNLVVEQLREQEIAADVSRGLLGLRADNVVESVQVKEPPEDVAKVWVLVL